MADTIEQDEPEPPAPTRRLRLLRPDGSEPLASLSARSSRATINARANRFDIAPSVPALDAARARLLRARELQVHPVRRASAPARRRGSSRRARPHAERARRPA